MTSGQGDDWVVQKCGAGNDAINCLGGDGNDKIYQEGGAGNDTIRVSPGYGNDIVIIDAGPGDDTIVYDVDLGTDIATIDGGTGTDTLTVNNADGQPILIQESNSNLIYQSGVGGTTITVINIEQITVNDEEGTPFSPGLERHTEALQMVIDSVWEYVYSCFVDTVLPVKHDLLYSSGQMVSPISGFRR